MAVIDSHYYIEKKWREHNGKDNGENSSAM